MQLSDAETKLIRETYLAARRRMESDSEEFYQRLFTRMPEVRRMFRDDLAEQGMRFMTTIGLIVRALDEPNLLAETLEDLGVGHAALGVRPAHYEAMTETLIDTLSDVTGDDWSVEAEVAWRNALNQVAAKMMTYGEPPA
ncbi:hypothetical protein KHP62_06955 [Rhodobacteraceae bacterium NNCM2]|nr:hypothetical protein [Coraliihabitans acroporae]